VCEREREGGREGEREKKEKYFNCNRELILKLGKPLPISALARNLCKQLGFLVQDQSFQPLHQKHVFALTLLFHIKMFFHWNHQEYRTTSGKI
jgi:hypothetical protein